MHSFKIDAWCTDFVMGFMISFIAYLYLTFQVDPNIIGGMILSIGDRYVDMSIATRLRKYEQVLNQAVWNQ